MEVEYMIIFRSQEARLRYGNGLSGRIGGRYTDPLQAVRAGVREHVRFSREKVDKVALTGGTVPAYDVIYLKVNGEVIKDSIF